MVRSFSRGAGALVSPGGIGPESFAFDILFATAAEDSFPRKIDAEAWFDRWDSEQYEVYEQSIRIAEDEILTLVQIDDDAMLS